MFREPPPVPTKTTSVPSRRLVTVVGLSLLIFAVVAGIFVVNFSDNLSGLWARITGKPRIIDLDEVVAQIEKYTELPDEEPSFAVVTDRNELVKQSFFSDAQNGDYVLLFKEAEQAILFRPSTKKIIRSSKISLDPDGEPSTIGTREQTEDEEVVLGTSAETKATPTPQDKQSAE